MEESTWIQPSDIKHSKFFFIKSMTKKAIRLSTNEKQEKEEENIAKNILFMRIFFHQLRQQVIYANCLLLLYLLLKYWFRVQISMFSK